MTSWRGLCRPLRTARRKHCPGLHVYHDTDSQPALHVERRERAKSSTPRCIHHLTSQVVSTSRFVETASMLSMFLCACLPCACAHQPVMCCTDEHDAKNEVQDKLIFPRASGLALAQVSSSLYTSWGTFCTFGPFVHT